MRIRQSFFNFFCELILGSFFKWVDKPTCPSCGSLTFPVGVVPPTPEEMIWGAGNVESYKCQYCGKITRFPRYNHPAKLLGKSLMGEGFSQQPLTRDVYSYVTWGALKRVFITKIAMF